jgi:hypothetical protein
MPISLQTFTVIEFSAFLILNLSALILVTLVFSIKEAQEPKPETLNYQCFQKV